MNESFFIDVGNARTLWKHIFASIISFGPTAYGENGVFIYMYIIISHTKVQVLVLIKVIMYIGF